MNKFLCSDCDWCGPEKEILTAPNPFDERWRIQGCPKCLEVNSLVSACEIKGCEKEVECGFLISGGYMRTCGEHYRGRP